MSTAPVTAKGAQLVGFGEQGTEPWEAGAPIVGILSLLYLQRNQSLGWGPKRAQGRAAEVVDIYLGTLQSCLVSGDVESHLRGAGQIPCKPRV